MRGRETQGEDERLQRREGERRLRGKEEEMDREEDSQREGVFSWEFYMAVYVES